MAENQPSTSSSVTNSFTKGMNLDVNETFIGEGQFSFARNLVNNSHDGQIGTVSNEPSNINCINLSYTLIGAIPLIGDEWCLFTTDNINSEIGIFDESRCTYRKVVNSSCLAFKRTNLITGVFRETFDCGRKVYWDDALNPSRVINIDNPPFIKTKVQEGDCIIETNTTQLDCEQLRLAQLLSIPCLKLSKGRGSGTLQNGSYQVAIAYSINEIRATDYLVVSEVQPLFSHSNGSSALELNISGIDKDFDEFELVIISTVNAQTVVKKLGTYSVNQSTIYIDTISPDLQTIPLNLIPLRTPAIEKSDSMYNVNNYLLRVGAYEKPDFNYQPQANNITAKWVAVKYPADYYYKGGNHGSYMRDEQYPYFIRWIHNTGDKSASYLISGRTPLPSDITIVANNDSTIESEEGVIPKNWQVYNTATVSSYTNIILPDGGITIAEGEMGYWESTEKYPDNKPEIWGNLCGKNIRHHKFPDNTIDPALSHYTSGGEFIVIMGVKFEGITPPLDLKGNVIQSIVGYEILRGSREGNKSIIAKGLLNNLRSYDIPGNTGIKGLYQNYPFNDLRPDKFFTSDRGLIKTGGTNAGGSPLSGYEKNKFSFHSPETSFSKPYLNNNEIKIYQEMVGVSTGSFVTPYKHPRLKALTNFTSILGTIAGLMSTAGVVSNGVTIGATEDLPISMQVGPISGPPSPPTGAGSVFSIAQGIIAYVSYAASLAVWIASIAEVVTMSKLIADATKEKVLTLFYSLAPKIQFALQYNAHGFYDDFRNINHGNTRRKVLNANYISSNLQSFADDYRINNLYRTNFIAVETEQDIDNPTIIDSSRLLISDTSVDIDTNVRASISGYYAALKVNLPSQYGQIDGIKQLPISSCVAPIELVKDRIYNSEVYFGGDVYINRYTEKNTMFMFNNWMFNLPDEFEYDYRLNINIPYPRFWIDSTKINNTILNIASDFRRLDKINLDNGGWKNPFFVKGGYFYLFNSGVRDFFVESEVNIALRDWEDDDNKRFYDPYGYTDLNTMFRSDIIKSNNYYKYDYSLSNSKLFNSYISWGNLTPRDFDPYTAESCYAYYPKRIQYSLPQDLELKKDNWLAFLPNNYKDFPNPITSIKSINKTGALIMFKSDSPVQFMGVDQLQTNGGIKITLGDGGLFNQPLQSVVNSDKTYQFGSCQNKYSVVSTPYGIFYMSQDQGKIFNFTGGLQDISVYGNKFWLAQYLPSQLLKKFPDYKLYDNPVIGIGCQTVYDSINEIVYFTKIDYKPIVDGIILNPDTQLFYYQNNLISFSDPVYFENASWTISFDPKNKSWISFHDWQPSFELAGKNHFMTVQDKSIWKHNNVCDSYCNFYGVDYPFEIEYINATGQTVNTTRSVEYILENYIYTDCKSQFQVLDNNFDRAIIYNPEQNSGLLKLNITPKNNPIAAMKYPIYNGNSVDILYSKEENKYRFNQFVDLTRDRGEFSGQKFPMFITQSNGYKSTINSAYIDYGKSKLQHKKFRNYTEKVHLTKLVSGNIKMIFKIANSKILNSPR